MVSQRLQLEPIHALNLREHIEQSVRSAILGGAFEPGERLVESTIAEQLNVSRAPVREALAALQREGIVDHVPRKGYSVVDFLDRDVEEIYSLRILLETEALRQALPHVTTEDLAEMQAILDDLGEAALTRDEPGRIVELDLAFHDCLCRLADHSRLYAAWQSVSTQARVLIALTSKTHYDHPQEPKELHQRILDACRKQDLASGELSLREHLLDAQRRARMALDSLRKSRRPNASQGERVR